MEADFALVTAEGTAFIDCAQAICCPDSNHNGTVNERNNAVFMEVFIYSSLSPLNQPVEGVEVLNILTPREEK